jgi:pentatricopeptide repeat protein
MTPCRLCLRTLARGTSAAFLGSKRWSPAQTILRRRYTDVVAAEDDIAHRSEQSELVGRRETPEDVSEIRDFILGRPEKEPETQSDPIGDDGGPFHLQRTLGNTFRVPVTSRLGARPLPNASPDTKNEICWVTSPFWEANTLKLVAYEEWRMSQDFPAPEKQFNYAPQTPARVNDLLRLMDEGKPLWAAFREGQNVSDRDWEDITLYMMQNKPTRTLEFLESCLPLYNHTKRRHFEQLHHYLVAYWWNLPDHPLRTTNLDTLAELLPHFVSPEGLQSPRTNAWVWRLITCCSFDVVKRLLTFMDEYASTHWHTWLQATTFCIKNGEFEAGVHTLLRAHSSGADLPRLAFAQTFAAILRAVGRQADGLRVSMRFYDYLSKCGMPLTATVCNVLMMNAADAGDLQTTLAIHKSMLEHGPRPNGYTYAALLRGWKLNIDDASLLNDIIRTAIEAQLVVDEPYVATEILHCLALHHQQKDATAAFSIVADAYVELFDVAPLQRLGLLLDKTQSEPKPTPNHAALGIMFTAYLTHLRTNNLPEVRAQQLYIRWRELMFSQEAPFATLAANTYIYSAFLYYYARIPKGMLSASQIIKDMQTGPPTDFPFAHVKPDIYCWSIYMFGFVRAGQMKLAEQILVYMRERGVEPTIDSRNILLSGYSGRQDLFNSLKQLREAEQQGEVWNEYTLKAISRYHDQGRLRTAYENMGVGTAAQASSTDELQGRDELSTLEASLSQNRNRRAGHSARQPSFPMPESIIQVSTSDESQGHDELSTLETSSSPDKDDRAGSSARQPPSAKPDDMP